MICFLLTVMPTLYYSASSLAADERAKPPLRAVLAQTERIDAKFLAAWKAKGATAVVVPLNSESKKTWAKTAETVEKAGLKLYPWIEVARDPGLADLHPDWLASIGKIHDDWRSRFPDAPQTPKKEDVIKAWPWVVIGYSPAYEAQREKVLSLLNDLPGNVGEVFLNDLQAGPSSCGCGNDQCRWALDYGSPPTAPVNKPGDDVATRFLAEIQSKYPKLSMIPVWATECEDVDLPGAKNGTGYCGKVACATGTCWPVYVKQWNPLVSSDPKRSIALAAWSETFRRDPKTYAAEDVRLFMNPPKNGAKLPSDRTIVVIEAWKKDADLDALIRQAEQSPIRGWVLAIDKIDQSWTPKYMNTKK
ncbi:MAG: hypothetical protein NVSMB14_07110 [Isosphaeraceae bacterium]